VTGRTLAVGITGGIGSGKSEAAKLFAASGFGVLQADAIARRIIDTDDAIRRRIVRDFGPGIYAGAGGPLDRKRMARLIFGDESLQQRLNAIVHPAVVAEIASLVAAARKERKLPALLVEAALLFEAGAETILDYVIAVEAPEELRIARIMARDGATRAQALGRIRAQLPAEVTAERADFVIRNAGSPAELSARCAFVRTLLLTIAKGD
jgi:dephospho-CoA kinase